MAESRPRRVRARVGGVLGVLLGAGLAGGSVLAMVGVIPIVNGAGEVVQSVIVRVLFGLLYLAIGLAVAGSFVGELRSGIRYGEADGGEVGIDGAVVADAIDDDMID